MSEKHSKNKEWRKLKSPSHTYTFLNPMWTSAAAGEQQRFRIVVDKSGVTKLPVKYLSMSLYVDMLAVISTSSHFLYLTGETTGGRVQIYKWCICLIKNICINIPKHKSEHQKKPSSNYFFSFCWLLRFKSFTEGTLFSVHKSGCE